MKPRFINETGRFEIDRAILKAETLLDPASPLLLALSRKSDWRFNTGSGFGVWSAFHSCDKIIPVRTYRPWNPWTKAIGYFDGKAIYINAKKLPKMTHMDLVANLCHEYAHAAGFSHGDNYKTEEKCRYSVPYFISETIERWI